MSGKKEFPNNFEKYRQADARHFAPITWEEFYEWKLCQWELPSSICCIIRAEHKETGKITEHVYQKPSAVTKRLQAYDKQGTHDVILATHEFVVPLSRPQFSLITDANIIDPEDD
jgi:hypothetical protein